MSKHASIGEEGDDSGEEGHDNAEEGDDSGEVGDDSGEEGDYEENKVNVIDARLLEKDWSRELNRGFNDGLTTFFLPEDDDDSEQIVAITRIMNEKLNRHFKFELSPDVSWCFSRSPTLYGGRLVDGSIVGVFSSDIVM